MDTKLILLLLLFIFTFHSANSTGFLVNPTLVQNESGAVCLTGKPASYYFAPGFGKGVHNWLVYLPGGGWCATPEDCIKYAIDWNITIDPAPYEFDYILNKDGNINPGFFDWNKVVITYCDGSSFTGDSQLVYNGEKLYFRGARIFDVVMQELLQKGMDVAQNALLAGGSAGGVATTLHCDGFRNRLPHANRVKCFSDAGYFFLSQKLKDEMNGFTPTYQGLITMQGSTNSLPKSCTSKLSPYLCFFAQNIQHDIKTPIFFLMSAFDSFQVRWTFKQNETVRNCFANNSCSSGIMKILKDLRLEFLNDLLPKQGDSPSKGVLITSIKTHAQAQSIAWDMDIVVRGGNNQTIAQIFGDWYFNDSAVYITDTYPYPYPCLSTVSCPEVPNN